MKLRAWLLSCVLLVCSAAQAGQDCQQKVLAPEALREAALSAQALRAELERQAQPLAIVARVGQDLRARGLVYSHAGLVVRDHPQGRWTVLHLLNECGSESGSLNLEGLVNFFADQPFAYQAKVIWLAPDYETRLLARLHDGTTQAVFEPRYSVIARVDSRRRQNSTGWLLEMLVAGMRSGKVDRRVAQLELAARDYQSDVVKISYGKRLVGGLFQANADFLDHPLSARLSGDYQVSTVRSIFRFLQQQDLVVASTVIRDAGLRGD